eukprot:3037193-Prymnesium_polylepis.1
MEVGVFLHLGFDRFHAGSLGAHTRAPLLAVSLHDIEAMWVPDFWDFLCVPARYDAVFRGRFLGPRDFSLPPLPGLTAPRKAGSGSFCVRSSYKWYTKASFCDVTSRGAL